MNNKKTILRMLGHVFLSLFALIIIGFFISPDYFTHFLTITHLCENLSCVTYLIYSPFVLLISVIFYALSRLSEGNIKENILETKSNNSLIIRMFLGIGLVVLAFIFNLFKLDGPDLIMFLIGLFFLSSSIIQLIVNYFKK
jgi:hypothetical protein